MAKLTNETIKMFALSSCIGATIKTAEASELRLISLNNQINKAMMVFSVKTSRKVYFGTSKIVENIWKDLNNRHDTVVTQEKLSIFIELLCQLVPPQHFKAFVAVAPYRSKVKISDTEKQELYLLAQDLNNEFNKVFGTKPYTYVEPKEKAVKVKRERDKKKVKVKVEKKLPKRNTHKSEIKAKLREKLAGILNK